MVYDFAEYYSLGLTREAEMKDKEFYAVAVTHAKTTQVFCVENF